MFFVKQILCFFFEWKDKLTRWKRYSTTKFSYLTFQLLKVWRYPTAIASQQEINKIEIHWSLKRGLMMASLDVRGSTGSSICNSVELKFSIQHTFICLHSAGWFLLLVKWILITNCSKFLNIIVDQKASTRTSKKISLDNRRCEHEYFMFENFHMALH